MIKLVIIWCESQVNFFIRIFCLGEDLESSASTKRSLLQALEVWRNSYLEEYVKTQYSLTIETRDSIIKHYENLKMEIQKGTGELTEIENISRLKKTIVIYLVTHSNPSVIILYVNEE